MKKKGIMTTLSLLAMTGLMGCLTGCEKDIPMQGATEDEIITTTAVDQDKTMITVRVEFGAGQQENLERVLEEEFPNVDIVLRHDGSTSSTYTVRANLEKGVECDLILSRRLPSVEDIADQYLLDLSAEPFVDSYYMNAIDSCASTSGKLYYLPGPSDVYGIVYDKTMFEEYGWEVPHSYSEFVALLDTIRQTDTGTGEDIIPLQVSLMYPDMFQILFNTYGYEDAYAGSENFIWLTEYQQGNGSMVGHMEPAVADFQRLFQDGIVSVADMDVTPAERSQMMYVEHSTAMIIECQNAVSYARTMAKNSDNGEEMHEIAMMPFWISDDEDGDYLYTIPSYYMAINKRAAEESEEKQAILLEIVDYLSSEEGQEMLIGDDFQISNIVGVSLNSNEFSEGIIDTVERGQIINTFYLYAGEDDKQVERQMLGSVKDMISGTMSVEEWLLAADEVRDRCANGDVGQEEVYGQVETTMTRLETAYTMAQMYAEVMDAPIGICYGGYWSRSTNGYFYEGEITDASLACITPEKESVSEDADADKIVTAYLTGMQIIDILNTAPQSGTTMGLSPYYVAAGLEVEFNPWAEGGDRVISCKLADGNELDPDELYEVAYFNGSLPDDRIEPERVLDLSWKDAFVGWLTEKGGTLQKPDMTLKLVYTE
jgi:ABC-type glycerol-3-phosphate transport system substrate-binding protein